MGNALVMATITGLWYWFAASLAGYTLFSTLKSPTFIGFVLGLIWGDPILGITAGGSIEVIYLGLVAPGGNIPSDKALAALIAVPLVLMSNMSIDMAVSIAVPVGIVGVFVNNIRRYGNAFLVHKADQYAEDVNIKGIWKAATLYSFIFGFIIRFPIVFIANYYGAGVINSALTVIPQWLLHGMEVMGGLLPALGFATTIYMIGKKQYMPLFIFCFFMVKYFGITNIGVAIFGLCAALVIMYMGGIGESNQSASNADNSQGSSSHATRISNEDAIKAMLKG